MEGGDHPLLQIIFPGPGACRSAGGGAAGAGVAGTARGPVWWDGAQPTQERRGAGLSQGVAAGKNNSNPLSPDNGNREIVMDRLEEIRAAVFYALIVIATCIAVGAVFVVTHEFIHSTTAYLLGHMQSPLDIVWGNPVTLDGWDEGVSYSAMFAAGQGADAAIVAVSPLIMHTALVIAGLYILLSDALVRRKWWFHLTFWLVIVNLMELVAYMPVRAFSLHGDIGNINHGLGLSPWLLFLLGTSLILVGLYYLYGHVLPRMYAVVAGESRWVRYVILVFSAFYLFIFRGSIQNALSYSPNMEWATGLFGYAAFVVVLYFCRPGMPWVVDEEKKFTEVRNRSY